MCEDQERRCSRLGERFEHPREKGAVTVSHAYPGSPKPKPKEVGPWGNPTKYSSKTSLRTVPEMMSKYQEDTDKTAPLRSRLLIRRSPSDTPSGPLASPKSRSDESVTQIPDLTSPMNRIQSVQRGVGIGDLPIYYRIHEKTHTTEEEDPNAKIAQR